MSTDFEFAYNKIPKNDGGRDKPTALAHWWDFWKEIHSVIDTYDNTKERVIKAALHYLYPPFDIIETIYLIQQAYKSINIFLPEDSATEIKSLMEEEVRLVISIRFKT